MLRFLKAALISLLLCTPVWAQQAGITPCTTTPAAQSVTVASSNFKLSTCGPVLIVMNTGTQEAFWQIGTPNSTAATTSSNSIPGNTYQVLNVGNSGLYFAAITGSSTTTLKFIQGQAF